MKSIKSVHLLMPLEIILTFVLSASAGPFSPYVNKMTFSDLEKTSTTNVAKEDFQALDKMVTSLNRSFSNPRVNSKEVNAYVDSLVFFMKELDQDDANIRDRFALIRERLVKAHLPPNILKRHDDYVRKYEVRKKNIQSALAVILPKDTSKIVDILSPASKSIIQNTLTNIESELRGDDRKLASNTLGQEKKQHPGSFRKIRRERVDPFGAKKPESPKLTFSPPSPEDTLETPDVQFTKELRALADSLRHDPRGFLNTSRTG